MERGTRHKRRATTQFRENFKKILNLYKIKYIEINSNNDLNKVSKLISICKKKSSRIAFILKPNSFYKSKKFFKIITTPNIKRIDIIETMLNKISKKTKIVSSVGYNSRELYQSRKLKYSNGNDFLMVGAMGHTLQLQLH